MERWERRFTVYLDMSIESHFFTNMKNSINILVESVSFDLVLHTQKSCGLWQCQHFLVIAEPFQLC